MGGFSSAACRTKVNTVLGNDKEMGISFPGNLGKHLRVFCLMFRLGSWQNISYTLPVQLSGEILYCWLTPLS